MKKMPPSQSVSKSSPQKSAPKAGTQAAKTGAAGGGFEAWWVVALGWLLPGLGYMLNRKWVRGVLAFTCVVGMFGLGLALRGKIYAFNTGDMLDMLGWVGDLCAGLIYFFSRALGAGGANPSTVMADYGTKFLIAAGLLNLLAASDARDVFLGKKK